MKDELLPRNRTARLTHAVAGNPPSSRLEKAVANCYPGLEFDIRILEQRFFPGLLFEFIDKPANPGTGARVHMNGALLRYIDYLQDPMLPERSEEPWVVDLRNALDGTIGTSLSTDGTWWYLDWAEQSGIRIAMYDASGVPLDGSVVWRLVRGLEPDLPLIICLTKRDASGLSVGDPISLTGRLRRYLPASAVFDASYRPGELTQSMCNPWTHDFRDCACHYWAASHPDIVLPQSNAAPPTPATAVATEMRVDWLRELRGPAGDAPAAGTIGENRPFQVDHYQINRTWEQLPIVLEGREIKDTYGPPAASHAAPYANPREMINDLRSRLAPMELALALVYLYALFSLRMPEGISEGTWPDLRTDLQFVRRSLMMIAAGEMTHLRWANQLLWELYREFPQPEKYVPVLEPARWIPGLGATARALRPLTMATLDDFISIERPASPINTAYAKCVETLESGAPYVGGSYPRHLYELAVRIDTDGMQHHLRFLEMKNVLRAYRNKNHIYLRDVRIGPPQETSRALGLYENVRKSLRKAYAEEAERDFESAQANIAQARATMLLLVSEAETLAERGFGVPFL